MSDNKPLEGRRVVVTRAAEQTTELAARLEALGAHVLPLPLIQFAPPDDTGPIDRALHKLDRFDWLFLTSRNAVRFLAERARDIPLDLATMLPATGGHPHVATVGSTTAAAAREQGWRVDRISSGRGGLDLARELAPELRGSRVLLPRSHWASSDLPRALAEAGVILVEVIAYKTVSVPTVDPAILERIERGEVDVLSFASPSAFSTLIDSVGLEKLRRLIVSARIAVIGPTTAAAIRQSGFSVAIEARVPTVAGLAAAIAAHFAQDSATPGRSQ